MQVDAVVKLIVEQITEPEDPTKSIKTIMVEGKSRHGKSTVLARVGERVHDIIGCRVVMWQPAETLMKLPWMDMYARDEQGQKLPTLILADDVDEAIHHCKNVGCAGLRKTVEQVKTIERVWLVLTATTPSSSSSTTASSTTSTSVSATLKKCKNGGDDGGDGEKGAKLSYRVFKSLRDCCDAAHIVSFTEHDHEHEHDQDTVGELESTLRHAVLGQRLNMTPLVSSSPSPATVHAALGDMEFSRWERASYSMDAASVISGMHDGTLERVAGCMRSLVTRLTIQNNLRMS